MSDFVECFRKVHYKQIGLLVCLQVVCDVGYKLQKLCFSGALLPETVLQIVQDVVGVRMVHDCTGDDVLH